MGMHGKEISCQLECFKLLGRNDSDKLEMLLQNKELLETFRKVINKVEDRYGRVPEPEELLFITSRLLKMEELYER